MSYSSKQVLSKFFELHTRLNGSDRAVSLATNIKAPQDPFTKNQTPVLTYQVITPMPIVTDVPDKEMLAAIGGVLGVDERVFVFLAHSIVDRDPIDTLGSRVEARLKAITGLGRGGVKHGDALYSISSYHAGITLVGVVPQWLAVGKVVR